MDDPCELIKQFGQKLGRYVALCGRFGALAVSGGAPGQQGGVPGGGLRGWCAKTRYPVGMHGLGRLIGSLDFFCPCLSLRGGDKEIGTETEALLLASNAAGRDR